jgi:putative ABC transport system permease protein
MMIAIALKNLLSSKGRSFLTIAGMAIGVCAIISLVAIAEGVRAEIMSMLGDMQGVIVMQKGVMDDSISRVPREYIEGIAALNGVELTFGEVTAVPEFVEGKSMMEGMTDSMSMSSIVGIMGMSTEDNEKAVNLWGYRITKGRALNNNDDNSVLLGQGVADQYNKDVGMSLKLNDRRYTVVGIIEASSEMMGQIVVMPLDEAYYFSNIPTDKVSMIGVMVKEGNKPARIADLIAFKYDDVDAKEGSEYAKDVAGIIDTITNFFWVVSAIAALIGGIGIINTMLMSVIERMNEFGLLRATGWTSSNILRLVMFESLWIGVIGGSIGIGLGYLGVQFINEVVDWTAVIPTNLPIIAFVFATTLALLSGIYPAYRATKVNPIDALRFA